MGTPFAVVYANKNSFIEDSMFKKLPEVYPKDIVESFIKLFFIVGVTNLQGLPNILKCPDLTFLYSFLHLFLYGNEKRYFKE